MLDNLRDQASFQDDQEPPNPKESKEPRQRRQLRSFDEITHMTARQRFALAVMLLVIVCLLGTMLLIIVGKVVPPFML
ncbi:MAG: hypothetical protein ABSG01_02380 [Anaerolineales bacterium]|jgi:hypothetical protein